MVVKVGLGFVVALAIDTVGLTRFKTRLFKKFGRDDATCGCDAREAWLNKFQVWIPQFVFNRLVKFEKKRKLPMLFDQRVDEQNTFPEIHIPIELEELHSVNLAIRFGYHRQYICENVTVSMVLQTMGFRARLDSEETRANQSG